MKTTLSIFFFILHGVCQDLEVMWNYICNYSQNGGWVSLAPNLIDNLVIGLMDHP